MKPARTTFQAFQGLNNVSDPFTLGTSWLRRADNCIVTGKGRLENTRGFVSRVSGTSITGAYVTRDLQRLYYVDDGTLYALSPPFVQSVIATGIAAAAMHFTEVNGVVYYSNGVDLGSIEGATALTWGIAPPAVPTLTLTGGSLDPGTYGVCATLVDSRGRESGNSDVATITTDGAGIAVSNIEQRAGYLTRVYVTQANGDVFYLLAPNASASVTYAVLPEELGPELAFMWMNEPHGVLPNYFAGRMYLLEAYPQLDKTLLWRSLPGAYHLFDDGSEGFAVPGTGIMLAPCNDALILGTERAIYAIGADGKRTDLADYGVVPGYHAFQLDDGKLYFWTLRGLCRALPFENLTESMLSVAPGVSAGGMVLEQDGYRRYLLALKRGGSPYNRRT